MVWNATIPTSATKVKDADDAYRANFAALEDAIEREHVGMTDSGSGYELTSRCGVVTIDTYTNIDALSDVEGGLAFATDMWDFYINDGAAWQRARQIESGTVAFFYQSTAPTGWTLVTTLEDRIILLDDTAGGGTGGTWTATGLDGQDHPHTYTTLISHSHTLTRYTYVSYDGSQLTDGYESHTYQYSNYTGPASPSTSSTTSSTVTVDNSWRPKGFACLACSKD